MKRYPLPDLLKGFAVLLIVPVHILETFMNESGRESLFGKTLLFLGGPVAVPVFMIVMGYFVALSKKSTMQNLKRGILIFIMGFFLNLGLNFHLLLKIWFSGWPYDPLQYIFGVDIFYLAGISIAVLTLLKTIKTAQEWIVLTLILFISGSTGWFNQLQDLSQPDYLSPFLAGKYSWSYFPVFPWLSYPLLGFLFQRTESQIIVFFQNRKIASIGILLLMSVLVVAFFHFGFQTTINLPEYYHHTFPFFLWTLGVVLLWVLLLWLFVRKFYDLKVIVFVRWLGKNITSFYVIQWLIIGNIATSIYQTQQISSFIWWWIPIFLLTLAITFLYNIVLLTDLKTKSNRQPAT